MNTENITSYQDRFGSEFKPTCRLKWITEKREPLFEGDMSATMPILHQAWATQDGIEVEWHPVPGMEGV